VVEACAGRQRERLHGAIEAGIRPSSALVAVLSILSWVFGLFLLVFKAHVIGLRRVPKRGPVILACNHQSFFDPPLVTVLLTREASYLARDTLFSNRWFGWLIRSLNAIPVRRNHADVGALKEMLRRLRAGYVVVTFPEATRTQDGRIGPMRPGTVLLAQRARATIVPVCIDGAFEAWPRGRALPWLGRVVVMYGEPIGPEEMAGRDAEEVICEVRRRIVEMQQGARRVSGRRPIAYDSLERPEAS